MAGADVIHPPVMHTEDFPAEAEAGDMCFVIEPMPSIPSMPSEMYLYDGSRWCQLILPPGRCPTCGRLN